MSWYLSDARVEETRQRVKNEMTTNSIDAARAEICAAYNNDNATPWAVSYSGGKDSTLLLSLVLEVALRFKETRRPLYVIFGDTGIEQAGIVERVKRNFEGLESIAKKEGIELTTKIITPPPQMVVF